MRSRNSRFRERQTRQLAQACLKPGVPAPLLNGPKWQSVSQEVHNKIGPRPLKFEYLIKHRGVKVILTDHCRKRSAQRHGMPVETMKDFFMMVVDGLEDFNWSEYNQEIFVYSGHYQRGAVVAWRRDFKNQASRSMCLAVVTIYPYGKATPAHPDTEIVYVG